MSVMDITDHRFIQALAAIDSGNATALVDLIGQYHELVRERIHNHEQGYFMDPYLLWFVADNPIRVGKLHDNILEIAGVLVQAVKREAPDSYQYQVDYALALVASGRIPRECGVQIALIDLLIDAGASPDAVMSAVTHSNLEAAAHLIDRGGEVNLASAVCLERADDINALAKTATRDDKITALAAAAFYGKEYMVKAILDMNADPNGFPPAGSGFHVHATPLHQAVSAESLACVKLLVEAGARLDVPDKIHSGTPLGWASYLRREAGDPAKAAALAGIESYLQSAS